jgi:hypothetical protein
LAWWTFVNSKLFALELIGAGFLTDSSLIGTNPQNQAKKSIENPCLKAGEEIFRMAFRHKYTLVCDEVRQENNGKFFIIGLYTGPIVVTQFPAPLGLTFAHFLEADRPGMYSAKLRAEHLETGRRLVDGHAQIVVSVPGTMLAPVRVPLQIEAAGAYHFVLEIEGESVPIITPFMLTLGRMGPSPAGMLPMR